MTPPTTRPIMIQAVSDRRYQGLRGGGAGSVMGSPPSRVVEWGDHRSKDPKDRKDLKDTRRRSLKESFSSLLSLQSFMSLS